VLIHFKCDAFLVTCPWPSLLPEIMVPLTSNIFRGSGLNGVEYLFIEFGFTSTMSLVFVIWWYGVLSSITSETHQLLLPISFEILLMF